MKSNCRAKILYLHAFCELQGKKNWVNLSSSASYLNVCLDHIKVCKTIVVFDGVFFLSVPLFHEAHSAISGFSTAFSSCRPNWKKVNVSTSTMTQSKLSKWYSPVATLVRGQVFPSHPQPHPWCPALPPPILEGENGGTLTWYPPLLGQLILATLLLLFLVLNTKALFGLFHFEDLSFFSHLNLSFTLLYFPSLLPSSI